MIIKTVIVGEDKTNCYIVGCEKTGEGFIIDPGDEYNKIKKELSAADLSPKFIFNTHGHLDHAGVNYRFGIPVYIHKFEASLISRECSDLPIPEMHFLGGGSTLQIDGISFKLIHTPAHTKGSACLFSKNVVFTGDVLLTDGIGRSDMADVTQEKAVEVISKKLFTLPQGTIVYPGHGCSSSIKGIIDLLRPPFI